MNIFPFLDRETKRSPRFYLLCYVAASIILWTLQCSLLQNLLGVDTLEAISWGAEHSMGNTKHPPFSGWAAEFFSIMAFRHDFGLYFACQFFIAIGAYFVYETSRLFFDELRSALSALLLYFLFYYTPSWMKFSTYYCEMALIPVAAYCFFMALEKDKRIFWPVFGFVCGIGMLNKYSFALQIICFVIIFFAVPEYRKRVCDLTVWLAPLVFFVVIAPHVAWLCSNDFPTFAYAASRVGEKYDVMVSVTAILAGAYPFVSALGVLIVCLLPDFIRRKQEKYVITSIDKSVVKWTAILSFVPVFLYVGISLTGHHIVQMWFCTLASWSGLLIVAAFPFRITPAVFRRAFILLCIVAACIFTGTTIDLLFRSVYRIHTKPEAITELAENYWKSRSNVEKIPFVAGDCWVACVMHNYVSCRPPACMFGDDVCLNRHRNDVAKYGALVIRDSHRSQKEAEDWLGRKFVWEEHKVTFKAPFGKEKDKTLYFAYVPPEKPEFIRTDER